MIHITFGGIPSHRDATILCLRAECDKPNRPALAGFFNFRADGRFVERDTTWGHFEHFRQPFETHGRPEAIYTDGLSLFGLPCSVTSLSKSTG